MKATGLMNLIILEQYKSYIMKWIVFEMVAHKKDSCSSFEVFYPW